MKLVLLAVACAAGCATDPDITEPILANDPTTLAFDVNGSLHFEIDAHAQTIAGDHVVLRDGVFCRTALPTATALGAGSDQLFTILDATFVTTLGDDSCRNLTGCGGDDTGYLGVTIDGTDTFTAHASCRHLSSQFDLEVALGGVFDATNPTAEIVIQHGDTWEATGVACPGSTAR